MFKISKIEHDLYYLYSEDGSEYYGYFHRLWDDKWKFELIVEFNEDINENVFPFIIKTISNMNKGVVY